MKTRLLPAKQLSARTRTELDWGEMAKELKQKEVTRLLLSQEYKSGYPERYSYSQFCDRFRRWAREQNAPVMCKPNKVGVAA